MYEIYHIIYALILLGAFFLGGVVFRMGARYGQNINSGLQQTGNGKKKVEEPKPVGDWDQLGE